MQDSLNHHEKVFFVMSKLDMEVNNGGFSQFFFNTNDEWNDILVLAAKEIGAFQIASICENALEIKNTIVDEELQEDKLNECDEVFYKSSDCISGLCVEYARKHKEEFKNLF